MVGYIEKYITKYGVFSAEVAEIMVKKISKFSNLNNLSISCTGQAGPNIISKKEDIGLVYIGARFKTKTLVTKKKFLLKSRVKIIERTVEEMINIGIKVISS